MSDDGQSTEKQEAESPDSLVGKMLGGQYTLVEKIGHGAMGSVYRAEQAVIERIVAIKILHAHLTKNDEYIRRFRREALVASKLTHPNIVRLFDFGVDDALPYLVMQFAPGKPLKSVLLSEGALPCRRVENILRQVGSALAEAHRQGIIHRDLKPDNIMLSSDDGRECAFILDFGIAKPIQDQSLTITGSLTKSGFFIGTPLYMAPEQALDRPLDARSDIYSLGVILYEMLSGETPFKSDSPMEMMLKHVNAVPVPVREFKPHLQIPQEISDTVHRALAKEPNDRFQTIEELVTGFTRALHIATENGLDCAVDKSRRTRSYWRPLAAGAVLCGLVGTGLHFLSSSPENTISKLSEKAAPVEEQAATPAVVATKEPEPPQQPEQPQVVMPPEPATVSESAPESPPPVEVVSNTSPEPVAPPSDETSAVPPVEPQSTPDVAPPSVTSDVSPALLELETPLEQPADKRLAGAAAKREADRLYREGEKIFETKEYLQAGLLFRQVLTYRNDHLGALLSLGVCLMRLGRLDPAYERFSAALKLDPDYAPTHYNLASYYALKQDPANTVQSLKRASSLYPKVKTWAKSDPDFDSVREDPEFQKVIS